MSAAYWRREASSSFGLRRSYGVIERITASMKSAPNAFAPPAGVST